MIDMALVCFTSGMAYSGRFFIVAQGGLMQSHFHDTPGSEFEELSQIGKSLRWFNQKTQKKRFQNGLPRACASITFWIIYFVQWLQLLNRIHESSCRHHYSRSLFHRAYPDMPSLCFTCHRSRTSSWPRQPSAQPWHRTRRPS